MRGFLGILFTFAFIFIYPVHMYAMTDQDVHNSVNIDVGKVGDDINNPSVQLIVSNTEGKVGDTIHLSANFNNIAMKNVYGMLRSPSDVEHVLMQERFIRFLYDVQKQMWVADYTVTPYDASGKWTIKLYDMDKAWSVDSTLTISNLQPLQDIEAPKLVDFMIGQEQSDKTTAMKVTAGTNVSIQANVTDNASGVQRVTLQLRKHEDTNSKQSDEIDNHTVTSEKILENRLEYNEDTKRWAYTFVVPETGEYEIWLDMMDNAGNISVENTKRIITVETSAQQPDKDKDKDKDTDKSTDTDKETVIEIPKEEQHSLKEQNPPVHPDAQKQESAQPVVDRSEQKKAASPTHGTNQKQTPSKKNQNINIWVYIIGGFALFSVFKGTIDWKE